MAYTIIPVNRSGKLEITDGDYIVGEGRAHASRIEGYVTLTLHVKEQQSKVGKYTKHTPEQFLVVRVPIDWVQQFAELEE